MRRLITGLVRRLRGDEAALAAQPLLAGYRREISPAARWMIVAAVAASGFAYGLTFAYLAPAIIMPLMGPIALLCGLVIWALPDGDYAPTRLLEPMFVAFFAALILWPNYLAIALPGLPWLTLLRIIGLPMVGVLLVCISTSRHFRERLSEVATTDKPTLFFLLAVIFMQTITLPISSDVDLSINKWIIAQTNWTAIFVISMIVFMRPGFATLWIRILLLMMFILCGIGYWENAISHVPWGEYIPSFLKIEDENVQRILKGASRGATGIYRVQTTSTTPLGFAEALGLATPFAMHLLVWRHSLVERFIGAIFLPLAVHVILLTDSRLGLVAVFASLAFYMLGWALVRWRASTGSIFAPAIVIAYPAIFAVMLASTFFIGRLRNEVWGDGSQSASDEARMAQWEIGTPKFIRNPIGHGIGAGGEELGYRNGAGILTIDSYYLSILLELGIIGFIAYYAFFIRGIWIASESVVKTGGKGEIGLLLPLSISLINYVIVKAVLSQDANHPLVFMMMGGIVALVYRSRTTHSRGG